MEQQNPFPHRSRRLALKPPLPLEVTSGRRRRSHSTKSSTTRTSGETSSSHKPEFAQVVSTHPGLSIVVEVESSQLLVVTIHLISETIPPELDVVQLEVDPDPIILLPEHLNPEVKRQAVVPVSVIP